MLDYLRNIAGMTARRYCCLWSIKAPPTRAFRAIIGQVGAHASVIEALVAFVVTVSATTPVLISMYETFSDIAEAESGWKHETEEREP